LRERKMIWAGELRYVLPGIRLLLLPPLPLPRSRPPTQTQAPRRWLMLLLMPTRLPRVAVLDYRTPAAANDRTRVRNE
jgi:hypothetical protein